MPQCTICVREHHKSSAKSQSQKIGELRQFATMRALLSILLRRTKIILATVALLSR